jgi:Flp pilus assembly protein TadD
VAACSLADRGDLAGAIRLMGRAADTPRRVRDHHLKQWYVLADLYDRSGDIVKARQLFGRVRALVPDYVDVDDRLRSLGR